MFFMFKSLDNFCWTMRSSSAIFCLQLGPCVQFHPKALEMP